MSFRLLFLAMIGIGALLSWRRPWILRGSGFLALSSVLAVSDALWRIFVGTQHWLEWATFWLLPVFTGGAMRRSWLVSAGRSQVFEHLEEAARAVRLESAQTEEGLVFGPNRIRVRWRQFSARWGVLTFPSKRSSKKMELLQQLFYKKLPPLFPRLKIRI